MSNFYDRYIKRTIGDCKSVKEHNLKELKDDFDFELSRAKENILCDKLGRDELILK